MFKTLNNLNCSEIIVKSLFAFLLGIVYTALRKYLTHGYAFHLTLDITVFALFLYALFKGMTYYKHYQGNKLIGLYDWDDHSNPVKVKETEKRLACFIKVADEVDILLSSGMNTFHNENDIKKAIGETQARVRILLLDPHDQKSCEKRLSKMNPEYDLTIDDFRDGIVKTIKFLKGLKSKNKDIKYRLYSEVPVFRIMRIDHVLHVQPYTKWQMSREAACVGFNYVKDYNKKNKYVSKFRTSLFIPFSNYFNELYERSHINNRSKLRNNVIRNIDISFNGKGSRIPINTIDECDGGMKISCTCDNQAHIDGPINGKQINIYKNEKMSRGVIRWYTRNDNGYTMGIKEIKGEVC